MTNLTALRPVRRYFLLGCCLLCAFGVLGYPGLVAQGMQAGLKACASVLIPALFPFMVITGFITLTPVCAQIAKPLAPITKYIFKLPPQLGGVILLSFLGGYPVGARAISGLLQAGTVNKPTAQRMLCICVHAAPSFVITTVGLQVLGSARAGVLLYLAQLVSACIIGAFLGCGKPIPSAANTPVQKYDSTAVAFVRAVSGAVTTMLNICGFVLVFSVLIALLRQGFLPALETLCATYLPSLPWQSVSLFIMGLLEVTYGILGCGALPLSFAAGLCGFLVGFGSVSVLCQVAVCLNGRGLTLKPFFYSRLWHGLLTGALFYGLWGHSAGSALPTFAQNIPPITVVDENTLVSVICFWGMCTILLLALLPREQAVKKFTTKAQKTIKRQ